MSILFKVRTKTSDFLYRNVFYHLGYGRPDTKADWEGAYDGGYWDFLETKEESGRYDAICKMVMDIKKDARVLDVGCGKGVLYKYLKNAIPDIQYTGLDISEVAVKAAKEKFPQATFLAIDFDNSTIDDKFDIIIFNETLEYFKRPIATLTLCVQKNMLDGGSFIISMYQGHDGLWKHVNKYFETVKEYIVKNERNQEWKVRLIKGK